MKHLFDMTIQVTEKEGNFIKKCIKKKALKILEKNCDKNKTTIEKKSKIKTKT